MLVFAASAESRHNERNGDPITYRITRLGLHVCRYVGKYVCYS